MLKVDQFNIKMELTKDQHYVSVFILKKFANSKGKIMCINLRSKNRKNCYLTRPESIMYERLLYEVRNMDGTVYEPNLLEKQFRKEESDYGAELEELLQRVDRGENQREADELLLAKILAFQIERLRFVRTQIEINEGMVKHQKDKELFEQAIYLMLMVSYDEGYTYLKTNGLSLSEEQRKDLEGYINGKVLSDLILDEILSGYNKTSLVVTNGAMCIGDNPVIIDSLPNIKYALPISPNHIIICANQSENSQETEPYLQIDLDTCVSINRMIAQQSNSYIVFSEPDEREICTMLTDYIN